ncbi:protein PLASTID MOVEMENT IMPAIRED 1-like [Zingiber officinale]|nr:protein PLASTID MOVEMENT IMPAIRED 1-like [Zingiber officinale]
MAGGGKDSNAQLLHELDALTHTMYQSHTARRTASLVLPRGGAGGTTSTGDAVTAPAPSEPRPRSRRMSMSPWRSRPKSQNEAEHGDADDRRPPAKQQSLPSATEAADKKGIWGWKPMRALSHIGMQRLSCLFSVEVVAIQGLPASMNGLRLLVSVRKKETKDGALQTMPSRVLQGAADFEETLFVRCHVYCSGRPLKFEPRPFLIFAMAIDAPELDFGRSTVDLSQMVKESMEKSFEGARVRQWNSSLPLAGKAKGGEIVVKLSFQIMEDGGVGLYKQPESGGGRSKGKESSFSFARKKTKSSFSISSPKITRSDLERPLTLTESSAVDPNEIEEFSLDDPAPQAPPPAAPQAPPQNPDDLDLPDFEVVDKGIEIQGEKEKRNEKEEEEEAESVEVASAASSEVVKEVVVHDSAHLNRLTELDAIAQQIKALESLMIKDEINPSKEEQEGESQPLDAEEDAVTREFLQLLELEDEEDLALNLFDKIPQPETDLGKGNDAGDKGVYVSDLGKGLGSVVQTRDGGYLAATNPFDAPVARKETPKLAMQISKPFILGDQNLTSGFDLFQKLASIGVEELGAKLQSLTSMDELMGKTAEQIAFEGMASSIISGRSKEGASSSAAKTVALLKTMAAALGDGRKERILTGIWNAREEPVAAEEILAFALQKIEAMAVEALKIQAGMAEEEAPFEVSAVLPNKAEKHPLDSAIPPEGWESTLAGAKSVTMLVVVQLRDPLRRYETVGAPAIAVIQASKLEAGGRDEEEEEAKYKVGSLHVGGMRMRTGGGARRSGWDGERQRLTARQWLVAYGLGKAGKKKAASAAPGKEAVWSLSSRIMADMWLKPMRNPDVKIPDQ